MTHRHRKWKSFSGMVYDRTRTSSTRTFNRNLYENTMLEFNQQAKKLTSPWWYSRSGLPRQKPLHAVVTARNRLYTYHQREHLASSSRDNGGHAGAVNRLMVRCCACEYQHASYVLQKCHLRTSIRQHKVTPKLTTTQETQHLSNTLNKIRTSLVCLPPKLGNPVGTSIHDEALFHVE